MNESRIIKSIKFHAIKHLLDGEYWQVDKLFSYVAAIVYPFIDQVKYDNQSGSIKQFVKVLSKFLRTSKSKNLDVLSFDGLVSFFISEFCPTVTDSLKKECLSESISLIAAIGADGFISWRGKTEVYNSIVNTYENDAYLHGYGDETYNTPIAEDEKSDIEELLLKQVMEVVDVPKIEKERQCKSNGVKETEEEKVLNKLWREEIFGDHYKECMPYVWKLRISYGTYVELKSKLESVCKVLKPDRLYERHSEKLLVYIAEWFKWEYVDREKNAFVDLGITETASRIWENVEKWQSLRYSGESGDRDIHLYSIYALGGFPLRYVKDRGDKFDVAFESILNREEVEAIVDKLSDAITNRSTAFKKSLYDNEGSWLKFIEEIAEHPNSLYNENDKDNEYVQFFYDRLENGRRESINKAIKNHWIFYTSPDSEEITGDIVVVVGRDGSNGCVAAEVVNSDEDQLYIGIESQNEIINYRKYSKTIDRARYVGWGKSSNRMRGYIEDLSQHINVCKYNIFQLQPGEGEIIKTFKLGNELIRLYAIDGGSEWTTLRDLSNEAKDKAALFPNNRYEIISDNTQYVETKIINGECWSLCKAIEPLQIRNKETGKIITIHPEGDVSIKLIPQRNIIKYYDSAKSLVKCYINDREEVLPLLIGVPGGKCITLLGKDNEVKEQVRFKDAEYTQNASRYIFKNKNPEPGVITLDINNAQFKKKFVYLPEGAIKRNWTKGTITFDNLSKMKIEKVSSNGDIELLDGNVYKDVNIAKLKINDIVEDTLQFRIYISEFNYIELDVYRPIYCRELSLNGCVIKRYDDSVQREERVKLPYVLRDKFDLRVFNEDGVSYLTHFREMRWFPLGRPQQAIQSCDKFDIYLYADRHIAGKKGVLNIGARGVDQYKFYYWSVKDRTQPHIVETSYDAENQRLLVPTECLKNGGLIFQSLNGCMPRHYITPIYANSSWESLVGSNYSAELVYQCYKIAVEHKVPFTQFYPLHYAVRHIDNLRTLYEKVMSDKSHSMTNKYVELHRFANEFCFEWILLPKVFWKKQYDQAIEFIECSNFINTSTEKQLLRRAVKNLFNNHLPQDLRGYRGGIVTVLKYMQNRSDAKMLPITSSNIDVIKELYQSKEWISRLLSISENN